MNQTKMDNILLPQSIMNGCSDDNCDRGGDCLALISPECGCFVMAMGMVIREIRDVNCTVNMRMNLVQKQTI